MSSIDTKIQKRYDALLKSSDFEAAKILCDNLIKTEPAKPIGWFLFADLLMGLGSPIKALDFARRAAQISPEDCQIVTLLAKCELFCGNYQDALSVAQVAVGLNPSTVRDLDTLANVYSRCNKEAVALQLFAAAAEKAPNNPDVLYNLATSHRFLGHTADAETTFSRSIQLNSLDYQSVLGRSQLKLQTDQNNHIDELKANLSKIEMNDECRIHYHYSIAKEYEDIEQHDAAFENFAQGASLKNQTLDYDINADINNINNIINAFQQDHVKQTTAGITGDEAIFVLGLPRSGTTLVERILSSHPDVNSGGELNTLPTRLAGMLPKAEGRLLQHSLEIDFSTLGQSYVADVRQRVAPSRMFIDKLPYNYLNIGYARLAMSQAKIVLLDRDPVSACYAMFKNLFGRQYYPFTYDLDSLATYHLHYQRLIKHWMDVLPNPPYVLSYEALVTNPEPVIRDLLSYCDLEWHDDCLEFYKNPEASTTSSTSQVRRPIYQNSVDLWKQYESQLSGLIEKLN
jgi:tetratricopeptide (TPR) repeat protein